MKLPRIIWRAPFVAGGMILLLLGMWGGLLRMGWPWHPVGAGAVSYHGALMVGGFLGTLISMERSVALGRAWTYLSPGASAVGGLCLLFGAPLVLGQSFLLLGSVALVFVFILLIKRQPTLFMITMGLGAVAWVVGNALWLAGWPIPYLVIWWVAFLVLTIFGERLELSRFVRVLPGRNAGFITAVVIFSVGTTLSIWWSGLGWFITALGMFAMSAWLLIHDMARQTIRQRGLPRFAAVCLLSGYFWIATCGVLIVLDVLVFPLVQGSAQSWLTAAPVAGYGYDSILHAVLLGFVFAMIFGHAPIIFPAVLGVRMSYHTRFYVHLFLLEIGVILRVVADLAGWWTARQWAGLIAAIAIVLFLLQTVTSISFHPAPPAPKQPKRGGRSISLGAITANTAAPSSPTAP